MDTTPFDFTYEPVGIHYGRGRLAELDTILAEHGIERALVVCGRNVGANEALMEPLRAGLGDRSAGVFAETTPDKRVATAVAAAERADETDADAFLPVGGGSSLDVATVAAAVRGRSLAAVRDEVRESGAPAVRDDPTPIVPVPTTLAGADLSNGAGIGAEIDGEVVGTGVSDPSLFPTAAVYDPAAFETTPRGPLVGSAMNGFDKAVESLYAGTRTPITDATAGQAIRYLTSGYTELLAADGYDADAMDRAVAGIVLAQYGISRADGLTLNLLHALGHGLRNAFGIQQGLAHAVIAPHGVRAAFDAGVDPQPALEAFGVESPETVIREIERVRDALELPTRLRELDGTNEDGIHEAAAVTAEDAFLAYLPDGYEVTEADARAIIEAAW